MAVGQYSNSCQHPVECVVLSVSVCSSGCWSLMCAFVSVCIVQVVFRDPVRYKLQKVLTVAAEGTYSGQVCLQAVGLQQQGGSAGSSRSSNSS